MEFILTLMFVVVMVAGISEHEPARHDAEIEQSIEAPVEKAALKRLCEPGIKKIILRDLSTGAPGAI